MPYNISHPGTRPRRNRTDKWLRNMLAEHSLRSADLIQPVFVQKGEKLKTPVDSMPGVFRFSPNALDIHIEELLENGIPAIALFPVVPQEKKSPCAKEAYNRDNLICSTVERIKAKFPEIGVICDVALDPYTTDGHDGLVRSGYVVNDETVEILCKQSLTLAQAGCDIIAPSDMMDGRVGAIRGALDKKDHENVKILSYAVKYASAFYGPFRDAVGSAENLAGADKKTYQMDSANATEAMREVALDISEGADMVMVKPGMPYLDIIKKVSDNFPIPVFAYQVSGEYAMLKAAAANGWLDWKPVIMESLLSFKRAGACGIFTYAALEVAKIINGGAK